MDTSYPFREGWRGWPPRATAGGLSCAVSLVRAVAGVAAGRGMSLVINKVRSLTGKKAESNAAFTLWLDAGVPHALGIRPVSGLNFEN